MITFLGHRTIHFSRVTWSLVFYQFDVLLTLLMQVVRLKLRVRESLIQMYAVGVQSLPVIVFSLLFLTLMLVTEFSFHMKLVLRQDSLVPAFSTLLMIRELGPVVTSMLLTSRIGSAIATEIGTMKITDQIDALRLLSLEPVEFLTVPRLIGCIFGTVALTVIAIAVGVIGGAALAGVALGYHAAEYFNTMFLFTRESDFAGCLLKSFVFGVVIAIVASYHGLNCRPGSEGVGNAATNSVVHASMVIIIADFFLTYLLYAL